MKTFILILFLILSINIRPQDNQFNFNSPDNIRKFADFLFCDRDYLRAALEYERILGISGDDTLRFKIGLSYSCTGKYDYAIKNFSGINYTSFYYDNSKLEILKSNFLMNNFAGLRTYYRNTFLKKVKNFREEGKKLFNFSYLFTDEPLPEEDEFLSPFEMNEREQLTAFYNWKNDPPYKSGAIAGIMSAVIPGSGKMYAGEVSDGIVALLVTGVAAFFAYDNFRAGHTTRAWIFTGLTAFFYGGNVYGSVAAAQVHNAKIKFEYNESVKQYLEENNYYSPEYDFCSEND